LRKETLFYAVRVLVWNLKAALADSNNGW
jgi:hypothetical protein